MESTIKTVIDKIHKIQDEIKDLKIVLIDEKYRTNDLDIKLMYVFVRRAMHILAIFRLKDNIEYFKGWE